PLLFLDSILFFYSLLLPLPPTSTLFPYTTLFRSLFRLFSAPVFLALFIGTGTGGFLNDIMNARTGLLCCLAVMSLSEVSDILDGDRKSTRLNSSHRTISYAVFCLKKKNYTTTHE